MKKWDRNHVKLQDFIIFRWLKDKLGLQLTFPEFHFETEAKVDFPSACI